MKTFSSLIEQLMSLSDDRDEDHVDGSEQIEESNEVHLEPHGSKGTHFRVTKDVGDHLSAGEIIHDSHVDDLRDMGYRVVIHSDGRAHVQESAVAPHSTDAAAIRRGKYLIRNGMSVAEAARTVGVLPSDLE